MQIFFIKNFNFLRRRFNVTQEWLAFQLEKSQSTVGGWGLGTSEPNMQTLVKISEIFGISLDYLLTVDIEYSKLITDEYVEEFKQKGKRNSKVSGKEKIGMRPLKVGNSDSKSNDDNTEEMKDWVTVKLLKEIDQKLDQLLISSKNKG